MYPQYQHEGCTENNSLLALSLTMKRCPILKYMFPFSPADEFTGLLVRSFHFYVTACAEARRLAQRAERSRIIMLTFRHMKYFDYHYKEIL